MVDNRAIGRTLFPGKGKDATLVIPTGKAVTVAIEWHPERTTGKIGTDFEKVGVGHHHPFHLEIEIIGTNGIAGGGNKRDKAIIRCAKDSVGPAATELNRFPLFHANGVE